MTSELRPRRSLPDAARTAMGGVGLTAAVALAGAFLAQRSLAADGVQAVMSEWGATSLGVAWSDDPTPRARAVRRAVEGVAIGLSSGGLLIGFARITGAVTSVTPLLSVVGLALALVHAGLLAMRDELLLHGLVLRLLRGRSAIAGIVVCGAASSAWAFGTAEGDAIPVAVLVAEGLAGAAFGALWIGERGAWRAWGAHAAWVLSTRGAVIARTAASPWGGGNGGILGGWAASMALLPMCVALVLWAQSRARRRDGR